MFIFKTWHDFTQKIGWWQTICIKNGNEVTLCQCETKIKISGLISYAFFAPLVTDGNTTLMMTLNTSSRKLAGFVRRVIQQQNLQFIHWIL